MVDTQQLAELKNIIRELNGQSLAGVDESLLTAIKDVNNLQSAFTRAWNKIGKDVPNGS